MINESKKESEISEIFGDSIKIKGDVEIINGDITIKTKNKFVQSILAHISNVLVLGRVGFASPGARYWRSPINSFNIYLGTDQTTPTFFNTTALTSPIGPAPGTVPNNLLGTTSNPSNGVFQITITATWNAGTVNGMVGEIGLYLELTTGLRGYQWGGVSLQLLGSTMLASRLSTADGSFSAFIIDNTKPLAITWTITVSFV